MVYKEIRVPVAARSGAQALIAWTMSSLVPIPLKARILVLVFLLCCPVEVQALRRADRPTWES
jgi:hypothetical protein